MYILWCWVFRCVLITTERVFPRRQYRCIVWYCINWHFISVVVCRFGRAWTDNTCWMQRTVATFPAWRMSVSVTSNIHFMHFFEGWRQLLVIVMTSFVKASIPPRRSEEKDTYLKHSRHTQWTKVAKRQGHKEQCPFFKAHNDRLCLK